MAELMEIAYSAVRAQGGREREALRRFTGLTDDHPSVGSLCVGCQSSLDVGDAVPWPIGPGDDEAGRPAAAGTPAGAIIVHADCAGARPAEEARA